MIAPHPDQAQRLTAIARILRQHFEVSDAPVKRFMALQNKDPFKVLVCTVLSARTRDQVTLTAAGELLKRAPTAADLRALTLHELETLVRQCGFYRTKAAHLQGIAQRLGAVYDDRIPNRLVDLLTLPGVGRKTANLVLALGYAQPAISVDIHVFRISNRLGLLDTQTPEQTETALTSLLPRRMWRNWNPWLVALGQTLCLPRRPRCEICPVEKECAKRITFFR